MSDMPLPPETVHFTGEMIYPWMFDDYIQLRPLKEAAEILATDDQWSRLYDGATLRANTVPCAAAVYYNDMYVERIAGGRNRRGRAIGRRVGRGISRC